MLAIAILVGGEGSRVKNLLNGKSKPEIEIFKNKKIIDYQIKILKNINKKIFFLSNRKFSSLKKYIDKKYYNKINYKFIEEENALGTSGCLKALDKYRYENYLVIDGDLIFNLNIKKIIKFHNNKKSQCTLLVHPNNHPFDSDCLDIDENNKVTKFYKKPHAKKQKINNLCLSGIKIINKNCLKLIKKNKFQDFSKNTLPKILKKRKTYAYNSREYIKDAGTKLRIKQVRKDTKSIKYKLGNISSKIPAIFLDKDGVINFQNNNKNYQDINKIIPGVPNALKIINNKGYLSVLVTNQPAVAKGYIKLDKLKSDFKNLTYLLGKKNCYVDRIYYCPHHPEKGFKGENIKFKKKCNCRKPKNGMFLRAINELNIDINKSYMIGDSYFDYKAAKNTNLKFIMIGNNKITNKYIYKKNLLNAVKYIFKK